MGETHLFFGCRNEAVDYIYREELEAFAADGLLTLHTAFSRDQVCIVDTIQRGSLYRATGQDVAQEMERN